MTEIQRYKLMEFSLFLLIGVMMLFYGTYVMFNLVYLFILVFSIARAIIIKSQKRVIISIIIMNIGIYIFQAYFLTTVTFRDDVNLSYIARLISVGLAYLPFMLYRFLVINRYARFYLPSIQEIQTVSFSELGENLNNIVGAVSMLKRTSKSISTDNLTDVLSDITRHNSFEYISNGSLTKTYFDAAYKTLSDESVYIVISNTGSAASEIISVFTQKQFNHASLSFDYDLKTIVSYNGGERVYPPGLNYEMLEFFNKKEGASIMVYRLPCTIEQKRLIIDKIKEINTEGSAYNLLGLVLKYSHKPNIMFCSQFVYKMLKTAGIHYFEKKDGEIRPSDLIELDYHRKLEFAYEMFLNEKPEKI